MNSSPKIISSAQRNWFVIICVAVVGVLVFTVVVSTKSIVLNAARRIETHQTMKWIGLALHQYHNDHGCFPPTVVRDENGRAMHSWRSLLQSSMADVVETEEDFRSYDFSQPWNSKANEESQDHHRFGDHPFQFLAVVGPHAAWALHGSRTLQDIEDRKSNTIMVIAMEPRSVRWHEPVDAEVCEDGILAVKGVPLNLSSGLFVLMADSSVKFFPPGFSHDELLAWLTIDAGDHITEW